MANLVAGGAETMPITSVVSLTGPVPMAMNKEELRSLLLIGIDRILRSRLARLQMSVAEEFVLRCQRILWTEDDVSLGRLLTLVNSPKHKGKGYSYDGGDEMAEKKLEEACREFGLNVGAIDWLAMLSRAKTVLAFLLTLLENLESQPRPAMADGHDHCAMCCAALCAQVEAIKAQIAHLEACCPTA